MRLDDPGVVDLEYRSLHRLALRRLDQSATVTGQMEWTVALDRVAQAHPQRVLDAGSGSADFAAAIAAPQVTCLDSSPAAVQAAQRRGLEAVLGSIEEIPFGDGSFDVVTCNWTLYHLAHLDRGLAELARVLRSGGRFVGMYNFPDHLEEVWEATGVNDEPNSFDAETGAAHLARHFLEVRREETKGAASWGDQASLQTYLNAYLELVGPLQAPPGPYPFQARRHNCVFQAVKG
ncbi:MAG: class I SAM-dependent methyltransferase [Candidatus Dormibacteria bacterium]